MSDFQLSFEVDHSLDGVAGVLQGLVELADVSEQLGAGYGEEMSRPQIGAISLRNPLDIALLEVPTIMAALIGLLALGRDFKNKRRRGALENDDIALNTRIKEARANIITQELEDEVKLLKWKREHGEEITISQFPVAYATTAALLNDANIEARELTREIEPPSLDDGPAVIQPRRPEDGLELDM